MIRLYLADDLAAGVVITPRQDQAHYLTGVMRQAVGDEILLFNGRDGEWRARFVEVTRRNARLRVERLERPQAGVPDVELVVAMVKRARVETIVEKAAELGARRVRLVLTERTNAERVRLDRLGTIAAEASEQTERLDVPAIEAPVKLAALLDGWDGSRRLLFCDEAGDAAPIAEALAAEPVGEPWSILIGPEGGFSPAERARLRGLGGVRPVSLGPRILRADTAAILALGLWQALLGDGRGVGGGRGGRRAG